MSDDDKTFLEDVASILLALVEKELAPVLQRLAVLEHNAGLTKLARPVVRVPAGREVRP